MSNQKHSQDGRSSRTETNLSDLNGVLNAFRQVNKIIIREKGRTRLIRSICNALVATRGLHAAWIGLIDKNARFVRFAGTGLQNEFFKFRGRLFVGPTVECVRRLFSDAGTVVVDNKETSCGDCPLAGHGGQHLELATQIAHRGKPFGILSVFLSDGVQRNPEEEALLLELAEDIAFALNGIEEEKLKQRNERTLRRSEHLMRAILETTPNCVFVKNIKGEYVLANRATADLYGTTPEMMTGRTDFDFVDMDKLKKEEAETFAADDRRVFQGGQPRFILAEHFTRPDGTTRWFQTTKTPLSITDGKGYILGIGVDITYQKQVEIALKEGESRFRSLIDKNADAILVVDKRGTVRFANPASEGLFGIPARSLVGTGFGLPMTENESTEVDIVSRTGEIRTAEMRLVETEWENETMCLASLSDITDRKKAEKENEILQAQLRQAQKMEAIGTLAGGIAHDFNNILSSVIGYTELATDHAEKSSSLEGYLQEVLNAGRRAKDLVRQIMTFSRQCEQEFKPTQVKLIAKEVLRLIKASLPSTVEIRHRIISDSVVFADPTQIHQVLINLCTNAAHAMGDAGGILEVILTDVSPEEKADIRAQQLPQGAWLKLAVSDTGQGMKPEIMNRIFEPFFTTKPKGEGTGMGLSVVHGIIKSLNGEIFVESNPGEGSIFNIYLPVIEKKSDCKVDFHEPIPTGNERIMVVDDEPAIVNMAKQTLQRLGYQVTGTTGSLEALEIFREKPEGFDLVVTDLTMPKMTGLQLAEKLLEVRTNVPIVLCTGFNELVSEDTCKQFGIRELALKPVLKKDFAIAVRNALDGATAREKRIKGDN